MLHAGCSTGIVRWCGYLPRRGPSRPPLVCCVQLKLGEEVPDAPSRDIDA